MKRLILENNKGKAYIIFFSILFLFSLFVHNHPLFAFESISYENDNLCEHIKINHSSEFCSACRVDGKADISSSTIRTAPDFYKINSKNLKLNFYNLDIALLKQTRAPPYIS